MGITKEYIEEVEWSCGDYAAQSILHYDTNETPEFTMYAISRELNAERSDKLTLRQFLGKFNITAEDCQKAFEECKQVETESYSKKLTMDTLESWMNE